MQHALQISRKVDYALRAMIYLASIPATEVVPFREIAKRMGIPADFLPKILKPLTEKGLVRSTRGAHGGYSIGKPASEISFLDVIEAVEGPIVVNLCLDGSDACKLTPSCTMYAVWKLGQEKMLEVYRAAKLDQLAMSSLPALETPRLGGPRTSLPIIGQS